MPGGKSRLLSLLTAGLKVGSASTDTFIKAILAGSVSVTTPVFAGSTSGSTEIAEATITGLSASYALFMTAENMSPCIALISACAGTGQASLVFGYTAGSGGLAAAAGTAIVNYLAVRT
jgi:hypothetical protein